MNLGKYRKLAVALGTAFVETVALWGGAPGWVVGLAGFVGAALVYRIPNDLD